jgi:tetratricopeptide (TPR) repeat protein
MTPGGCPDSETLAALAAGLLSGDALAAVAGHLDNCSSCLARAQAAGPATDPLVAAFRQAGPAAPHAHEAGCDEAVARVRALAEAGISTVTPSLLASGSAPDSAGPAAGGRRYRPERLHARGGLGEVHIALDEELSRQVALKRIQPRSAGDPDSQRRFRQEAEITARLEHPGVVPVYGLVQDDSGQPCYAMRFIQGETLEVALARFHEGDNARPDSGERRLALRDLLGRLVAVCNTIAYAHSKGVLHRDLKPANIMLGAYGETLVVDWGLAKTIGGGLAERSAGVEEAEAGSEQHTRTGQALGTPAYMSPEQAAGQAKEVGPATDVYGLGATLFAVLTGRPPLEGTTAEVMEQARQGKVPPPRALKKDVPRPLEAVCCKAMALRPEDRYETALALADDIEHWLADEPVSAYREPLPARLARWGRRHKPWVMGAAALMLTAIVALAGGLWAVNREREQTVTERDLKEAARQAEAEQRLRAVAEKKRANDEAAIARAVDDFLQEDLLGQADIRNQPGDVARNRNITVRELLDRAARRIDARFRGQEQTEAAIRLTLGKAYQALGEYPEAQKHLERSRGLRRASLGPDHLDTLESSSALGWLYQHIGRYDEAESLIREALDGYRRELGPDHVDVLTTMQNLAMLHRDHGRYSDAEPLLLRSLEGLKAHARRGPDHPDTLKAMSSLAMLYENRGEHQKAAPLFKHVEEVFRAKLSGDHPDRLIFMANLASFYTSQGRYREAEQLFQEVIGAEAAALGADHPNTLGSTRSLGIVYYQWGQYEKARPLFKKALDGFRARLGDDDVATLQVMNSLAALEMSLAHYKEAELLFDRVVTGFRAKLGPGHSATLIATNNQTLLYQLRDRHDEAAPSLKVVEERFTKLLKECRANLGDSHTLTLNVMSSLGGHYYDRRQYDKAEPLFARALEVRRRELGADHPDTLASLNHVALVHKGRRQYKEAVELFEQVLAGRRARLGPTNLDTLRTMNNLAMIHWDCDRYDQAEELFKQILAGRRARLPAAHPDIIDSLDNLGSIYRDRGRYDDAEPFFREAVGGAEETYGPHDPRTQRHILSLADLYSKQGKPHRAEPALRDLEAFSRDKDGSDSPVHARHLARLAQNLLEQKKYAEAESAARDCLTLRAKKEPDLWTTFYARSLLGGALLGRMQYAEAEPLLAEGYAGMKEREAKIPKDARVRLIQALERLVQFHDARGNKAEAARLRKELEDEKAKGMRRSK